jgi:hypothetical protein
MSRDDPITYDEHVEKYLAFSNEALIMEALYAILHRLVNLADVENDANHEEDEALQHALFCRTLRPNKAVHLTPAAAESCATESDLPQPQVTADR